jgi:murein L,D-transpeptidase YcbB/YkuD
MLRKLSLAACSCIAAALTVALADPALAQSASDGTTDQQEPALVAPKAATDALPAETTAPAERPERADAAPVVEIDPLVATVRQQLATARLTDSTPAERAALTSFYAGRSALVWVTADGFTARARHAMAEIAQADDWGLPAKAFVLPALSSGAPSPAALADAEIKLGVAVLKYARYARGGRLDPAEVSRNFDQKPTLRDPKVVLETVAGLETPGSYLRALNPQHPQFEALRQALLKLRAAGGERQQDKADEAPVRLPNGPALKLGMEHPDVALLRRRLSVPTQGGEEYLYDAQVRDTVAAFQRKSGVQATGTLTDRTRAALNKVETPTPAFGTEEQRLVINMERWRWLPEDMGELHVWDNIPEFQTRVVKRGQVIHQARIVVGKVDTQTTIFSANMRYVVFGPEWGVPDSIKIKELLPYLRPSSEPSFFGFGGTVSDTRILEKHNLRVSFNGKPVDASQIDWSQVDIRKFAFIQPSGAGNVLGAVKFRFPNKHDIYMHDTPQRELFEKTVRTFSHGCVRVQNPGRLAEVLLDEDKGWSNARVREMMAQGGNVEVSLTKQIPVHITYFTTVAAEDGQVRSFPDVYGHDKRVAAALAGRPLPLEPPQKLDTTETGLEAKESRRPRRYDQSKEDAFSGLFGN